MPFKAKFIGGLRLNLEESDFTLTMVVSKDNAHQTGDQLLAFIDLVNRHKKIAKLRVIVSDYLNRHYIGEERALLWGEQWIITHTLLLKNLKIPYKVFCWREFFNKKPEWAGLLEEIQGMPVRDNEFATILHTVGLQHAEKAGLDAAKNYLIEDCASAVVLSSYNVAYPAKQLNKAIRYVLKAYNKKINYHGYAVSMCEELTKTIVPKVNTNDLLFFSLFQTQRLMVENGIDEPDIQVRFFDSFLKNKEMYAAECKKIKIEHQSFNNSLSDAQAQKIHYPSPLNQ